MERRKEVNNAFYDDLGDKWYTEMEHPIALLRAENATRNPWILEKIQEKLGKKCAILDVGCGAGFLSNALALAGHQVTGIDLSPASLQIAKSRDITKRVVYLAADAHHLPFEDQSFDVVCAMDILEHVQDPEAIIREASRLLRPGGLFFFHTFNRNWLSFLVIIKGVEWFMKNTPKDMHLYSHFIKPRELKRWCRSAELHVAELRGLAPEWKSFRLWRFAMKRSLAQGLKFRLGRSVVAGYLGYAEKL